MAQNTQERVIHHIPASNPSRTVGSARRHGRLRVAAYCRVSTDSEEQINSYTAQKAYYAEKIEETPEWEMAGLFADEGLSGTSMKKRKDFNRMITACKRGNIDLILTKSLSRFARNTVDCLEIVRMLKARGIGVIFEKENINTLTESSEFLITLFSGFAQAESESLGNNVGIGIRMAMKEGKVNFHYNTMLGYRKGADGSPEIVPEEAEVIRRIYQRYLDGCSEGQIQKELDRDGIPTARGVKAWSHQVIHSILTNEKYVGDALLQKTFTTDCITKQVKKNNGKLPQYYIENNHPAIIPRHIYQQVREEMTRRASKRKVLRKSGKTEQGKYSGRYALSEKLICGECETPYKRVTWARNGEKRIVWRCISRLEYGKKYCRKSPTMPEEKLHSAVLAAINRVVGVDSEFREGVMELTQAAHEPTGIGEDLVELERRLEELTVRQNSLLDRMLANMEDKTLAARLKETADEKQSLTDAITAAKAAAARSVGQTNRRKELVEFMGRNSGGFTQYDDEVVRKMVDRITVVDSETIRVKLRDSELEIEQAVG